MRNNRPLSLFRNRFRCSKNMPNKFGGVSFMTPAVVVVLAVSFFPAIIEAQRTPAGGQFQVNSLTPNNQNYPRVGKDGAGNFVIVRSSFGSSGSDSDGLSIQGQRFNGALPPPSLSVVVEGETVTLTWTPVDGASGYTVIHAPFPHGTPIGSIDVGPALSISGTLNSGDAFFVAVRAFDITGPGSFSNIETFEIP